MSFKSPYNNARTILLTLAVVGIASAPSPLFAKDTNSSSGDTGEIRPTTSPQSATKPIASPKAESSKGNFCTNITAKSADIAKKVGQQKNNLDLLRSGEQEKIATNRTTSTATQQVNRTKQDNELTTKFDKLTALAKTDSQREAVATFQKAVQAAVTEHRAAIDAANTTLKKAVDQDRTAKQAEIDQAVAASTAAFSAAITEAKNSCAQGVPSDTVRSQFNASTQKEAVSLKTAKDTASKLKGNVPTYVNTNKKDIQAADQAYKNAVKSAGIALKAAFSTSPTPASNK